MWDKGHWYQILVIKRDRSGAAPTIWVIEFLGIRSNLLFSLAVTVAFSRSKSLRWCLNTSLVQQFICQIRFWHWAVCVAWSCWTRFSSKMTTIIKNSWQRWTNSYVYFCFSKIFNHFFSQGPECTTIAALLRSKWGEKHRLITEFDGLPQKYI